MMQNDTVRLLNECHMGAEIAVSSIDAVMDDIHSNSMREHLELSRQLHAAVGQEAADLLRRFEQQVKGPGPMTKRMVKVKSDLHMTVRPGDSTAATLMCNGCHMGTKLLARKLNRLHDADIQSRELTRRLIGIEDKMACGLRAYL